MNLEMLLTVPERPTCTANEFDIVRRHELSRELYLATSDRPPSSKSRVVAHSDGQCSDMTRHGEYRCEEEETSREAHIVQERREAYAEPALSLWGVEGSTL